MRTPWQEARLCSRCKLSRKVVLGETKILGISISLLNQTRSLVFHRARVFFAVCGFVNISKQSFKQPLQRFRYVIQASTGAMKRWH